MFRAAAGVPSSLIRRRRQAARLLDQRIGKTRRSRVAEIAADDSNKTNFLRELAIETKNLQTDAPAVLAAPRQDNEIRIKGEQPRVRGGRRSRRAEKRRGREIARVVRDIPRKTNPIPIGKKTAATCHRNAPLAIGETDL